MPSCGRRHDGSCLRTVNCAKYEDDGAAWRFLEERGYSHDRFVIDARDRGHIPTPEMAALCYLQAEWDWDVLFDDHPERKRNAL